jgi:ribosomal protein L37AE/L43A
MLLCDEKIVSEHHGIDENENIHRRSTITCESCGSFSVIRLEPIIWNANHDIYYTGGNYYLPVREDGNQLSKQIKEAITPSIEQFFNRVTTKENHDGLTPSNLVWWLQGEIEQVVARAIREMSAKRQAE